MSESILFPIAFIYYFVLIIVKFSAAAIFYKTYYDSKVNKLVLGASLLFLFSAISRIIMVIFDFPLTKFDSSLYQNYAIIWKIGYFINNMGYVCLIFISEIAILKKKSRFLISIFYFISLIISIVPIDIKTVQVISIIPSTLAMIFIPLTYLFLAKYKTIRTRALAIFGGYILFFTGSLIFIEEIVQVFISLNPSQALNIRSLIHIISISVKIVGIGIMIYGYRKKLV
ncbi:MAG: hypothetical protein EU541_00425 [Promethearchaeota archaeon]|nr:MAG: hypothetical protein EU541_00425 [Candidatus Lokiarchaeota archaeon]